MDKRIKAFMYGWSLACVILWSSAIFWSMLNGWTPITMHFNVFSEGLGELVLCVVALVLWTQYIIEVYRKRVKN